MTLFILIRYKNKAINSSDTEDQLTFRNAGVRLDKIANRNLVQLCATEGAVSAFFTHLSISDLKDRYLDPDFYRSFLYEFHDDTLPSPKEVFSPLQNQFIKYFFVLHNDVVFNNSQKSQLTDFIDGYMDAFPEEESTVREIFREALGMDYSNALPPPLWILVKDYSHRLLVFDPFDAITVPLYTFDLNAAEKEDLLTIQGISSEVAQEIIKYREDNGYFTSLEQLEEIPGLPEESVNNIVSAKFNDSYFEEALGAFDQNLSISALIVSPLKHIFTRSSIYFLFIFGILYFSMIKALKLTNKKIIGILVKYFLLWNLLVFSGLFGVLFFGGNVLLSMLISFLSIALLSILFYRKKKIELKRTLIFLGMTSFLIFASVV